MKVKSKLCPECRMNNMPAWYSVCPQCGVKNLQDMPETVHLTQCPKCKVLFDWSSAIPYCSQCGQSPPAAVPKQTWKTPTGEVCSYEEYIGVWDLLMEAVEEVLDCKVVSNNPGMTVLIGRHPSEISTAVALQIQKYLTD